MIEIRAFILNSPNENDSNQITSFEGHTDKINENWILICKIHSSLFTKFVASAMTIMSQEYSSAYLNFILHVP